MALTSSPPLHVAIIMDGNGRWARERGFPRIEGHRRGAEAARQVVLACQDTGISYLTLYTFSTENWNRPKNEIQDLMELLRAYLEKELASLHEHNIRINIIGNRQQLAPDIQQKITFCEEITRNNTGLCLTLALSYGSREEIVQAAKMLVEKSISQGRDGDEITEDSFERYLYTSGMPEPDLLIRTGGEQRLSNFLLWQMAYTELYFSKVLWPDFSKAHLLEAIEEFKQRERRYGAT